ncbi:hypothetical protein UlMin_003422 [Ulmus minor]
MGGGGAMRAASKVAGIGTVINSGLRGAPPVPPAEHSVRKSSIPVSKILSSSSASLGVKASASDVGSTQRPVWELEEWDLAGDEGELVLSAGEPMPRVVFGGAPSFQEAKEATDDLKDALDKVYLSSPMSSESGELASQISDLSLSSESHSETKACLVETTRNPSVPNNALKAFKLLSTSMEAQNVVASIASDPNVWTAVMANPVLKDFMQSNQTITEFQEPASPAKVEESSTGSRSEDSGNWFSDALNRIKLTVVNLVSNVSSYLDNIFGHSADVNGDAKATSNDKMTLGATFMGLAVLVAMVVLLKRT